MNLKAWFDFEIHVNVYEIELLMREEICWYLITIFIDEYKLEKEVNILKRSCSLKILKIFKMVTVKFNAKSDAISIAENSKNFIERNFQSRFCPGSLKRLVQLALGII